MAKLFNRAKMTTTTTGSGTITLGSASNGFQSFADAGVANGDVVQYVIEEGANFEIGTGTYSATGTSLTRTPTESSNSDNAITLAGQATVSITAVADDLNRLQHNGTDKVTVSSTGASVTGNLAVTGTVDGVDIATRDGVLTTTKTTADAALPKSGGTMTGTLDLEGGSFSSGVDTNTNAALVVASGKQILGDDGNYLRNLVKWTSGNQIEVGQGNTSLITGINLLAGSTGTVKANGQRVFAEDYHPNADKWTTSRTLSLTGGVTGSVSWDGSANASLTSTVALATASAVGGIKIGYTENGKNYPVELDSNGKAYVNVPWTDTDTTAFNSLTAKTSGTGDYATTGAIQSGKNSGGVALTINDGYGNANVTWNHKSGVPEQTGQAARIEVNTDAGSGSEAEMSFELSSAVVTSGAAVNLPVGMKLAHDYVEIPNQIRHQGDTDTYMQFHDANSWRVVTGGTERIEATNSGIRIDDAFTLPTTDGSANQVLTTDGSGNVSWTTQIDTDTNTNQLTTFVVQDGDSTNVTISQGKYLKFAEGGAIDVNFTDTSTGSSGDPYDLTISHADTSSQGSVNNSNGTVIQDVTLDTYGHVTGLGSVDLDNRYQQISDKEFFSITNSGTTAGTWLGSHSDITAYFDGMTIAFYQNGLAGASTTTLNINSLGAKTIYYANDSKLTTHYGTRSLIMLQYDADQDRFYAHDFYYSDYNSFQRFSTDITVNNSAGSGVAVHGYQLLLEGYDGKFYPVTEGGSTGNTNAVSTANLKLGGLMLQYDYSTDYNANATLTRNELYIGRESSAMEYWNNRDSGWATVDRPVYLVGTVQTDGSWKLDNTSYTSFLTQTLPTSDDGKIYVQIGMMADNYDNYHLYQIHPIFIYKDGGIKTYSGYAEYAANADLLDGVQGSSYLRSDQNDTMSGQLTVTSTNDAQILLQSTDTWTGIGFNDSGSNNEYIWHNGGNGTFAIGGGGSNVSGKKLHIDGGTTIGVNYDATSTHTNGLKVEGHIETASDYYAPNKIIHTGDTDTYMQFDAADSWRVVAGGGEKLSTASNGITITSATGNATFGSSNSSWFHMSTDRPNFYMAQGLRVNGTLGVYNQNTYLTSDDMYLNGVIYHYGDTDTYIQFHAADEWRVVTGGTERLEVNNTHVFVNNDFIVRDDAGIYVQTDTNGAGAKIKMSDRTTAYEQNGTIEYLHQDGSSYGSGNAFKFYGTESSMSFHVSGHGYFTGNVATAYSDERLKDFDGKIEGALNKLSQINGYYYHANDTAAELGYDKEPRQVGVSAQEVEAVMPEVIAPAAIDPEYKTVHYDRLVPLLIEAIKEQQTQIDALTAQVEELKRQ